MTVDQALAFFEDQPRVIRALTPLAEVGLGYIRLGQPINTLSGGEAQRLKLSRYPDAGQRPGAAAVHLRRTHHRPAFRGHRQAADGPSAAWWTRGNTVLVIEHNMDVIKTADWVIDLGPEGGDDGGRVVAAGPPEEVAHTSRLSHRAVS